jgi:DNA-binding SARP family transcriptional activator
VILEQGGAYAFNNAADRYSDVEEYEKEIGAARRAKASSDCGLARVHYQRAMELHRGAFLAEFRYDDWSAAEIARQHELYLDVLEEAARVESSGGNFHRAVELLRLATVEDPLRESSYVELMRNLWIERRRTEALRVYHRLRDILARRLDVEPQPQTIRLYEAIRRDQALTV